VQSDPIGLNGGVGTFTYAGGKPVSSFDPSGLDWIEYTGQNVSLYGGNYGDRSSLLLGCAATSGAADFQNIMFRDDPDGDGPLPTGKYKIDLTSDPGRYASITEYGTNLYSSTGVLAFPRFPGHRG